MADAGSAAVRVSGMELGGLFGSLLAGRLSDFLVRKFPNDGAVGKRVQVHPQSRKRHDEQRRMCFVSHHLIADSPSNVPPSCNCDKGCSAP